MAEPLIGGNSTRLLQEGIKVTEKNRRPWRFLQRPEGAPSAPTLFTGLITAAWIGAYVIEIFSPSFEAPSSLDPLMLLVVGAYFTNRAVVSQKKEEPDE